MKFPISDAALAQHMAILGKTGAGKTSIAKGAVEHLVAQGARVCILDPIKSDWWGLTSMADGKKAGLPFQILGGPRGHVPLHPSSGKVIAELVASGALPLCILDMADFPPGGMAQFFNDFAPTLLRKIKGVVHLVLEEAHEFAPKERAGIGNENMLIHNAKKLATAGRSRGLRMILATQRIQALHNALLGSCDTMVALRLTAPADQKPVVDWLKANLDKDRAAEISTSLAKLKTGTGWVCSGETEGVELVQFDRPKTYDNSATPEAGAKGPDNVRTAAVDVEHLRTIVGDAVKETEENDPKLLRKKIVELTKALARKPETILKPMPVPVPPGASREEVDAAYKAGWDTGWTMGCEHGYEDGIRAAARNVQGLAKTLSSSTIDYVAPPSQYAEKIQSTGFRKSPAQVNQPPKIVVRPSSIPGTVSAAAEKKGPEGTLLRVLAWWEAIGHHQPTRAQVAAVAGWKVTAGHLNNVSGRLRSSGLIDYPIPGHFSLTDEGRAVAPAPDMGATLLQGLAQTLSGPQNAVLDTLLANGRRMTRQALCDVLGWNPTAGHVNNVLGGMRTLQVIDYPEKGSVELKDWVQ